MVRRMLLATAVVALAACSQAEAPAAPAETPVATMASAPTPAMSAYTAKASEEFTGGPPVTPGEVSIMIEEQGAQPAVAALDPDGGKTRWTSVMAGIATGDAAWLALAPSLEPGTENASYADLNNALKAAMVVNPSGVLAIVDEANPNLSADSICQAAGVEMDAAWYAAYYDALTPAVESVTDPSLSKPRAACLTILKGRAAG